MMSDKTKSLIVWLIILAFVLISVGATFLTIPNFIGTEHVIFPDETSSEDTTDTKTTTQTPDATPLVNINTATKEQLMEVPGIGEVYAQRILDYRNNVGAFESLEELLEIDGIGNKRLQNWSQYLTV